MTGDDLFSLGVLIALPAAVAYPVIYGFSVRWWKDWIGRALLVKAAGLADLLMVSAAYRAFGPDYWGRDFFRIFGIALVAAGVWLALIAMLRAVFKRRS